MKEINRDSKFFPFDDYVQIYESALSHDDIMAIAAEFVREHPGELIIFASNQKAAEKLKLKRYVKN